MAGRSWLAFLPAPVHSDLVTARYVAFICDGIANSAPAYSSRPEISAVKDYLASIEKLRKDAADAAIIRDLATDPDKREMYHRLHHHFSLLADEVERIMTSGNAE